MCGFSGIIHWEGEPVFHEEMNRMANRLKHRGPDELCAVIPEKGIGLVHARLKVIDLSDGARQPMSNEEGSVWIVYNGEVYNFQELRGELEAAGVLFRGRSDTEVVLRAYEAWGSDAIRRFNGMFALGIWDARRRELLLARDKAGKKPLFYFSNGRCAAFASEIKALLDHPHVPNEVNESVLPFLLAFGYPPVRETCYRSIRQLPPACLLHLRFGELDPSPECYWDLDFSTSATPPAPPQAAREVRRLLTEAVHRRLVSDVPVGAFLSGGIDSTIVVGLMSELLPGRRVKTFSIGFEGDARFDETRYANIVARRFRTDHTTFTVTPQSFSLLEELVWHHDQPFGDSSAIPTYLLSKLTREQVTVALTGDGGDEAFAGYVRFLASGWADAVPPAALRGLTALFQRVSSGKERTFLAKAKRFIETASCPLPERYWRWIAYFKNPARMFKGYDPFPEGLNGLHPSLTELWKRSERWSPLSRLLYLNFKEYLPNDLLVKMDRCSMAHGLEVRSPFLDAVWMEYVASLPDSFKIQGRKTKILLKLACADLLPPAISRRRKMGFGVPLGTWFRGQWNFPMRDLLGSPTARIYRYLERSAVEDLVSLHLRGEEDAGHRLWLLLMLEIWLRQRGVCRSSRESGDVIWLKRREKGEIYA